MNSFFYLCLGAPEAPSVVRLSVSSSTSLTVSFQEPPCFNTSVVTKYRGIEFAQPGVILSPANALSFCQNLIIYDLKNFSKVLQ